MATTIQITPKLQQELSRMKFFERETYEEVIWDLIEDTKTLNAQTKKEIELARKEIREGKSISMEQLKKELGL